MQTVLSIAESLGLILGSLVAGIALCWLLWSAFKRVRHPAWGAPIVALPAIAALAGKLTESPFVRMTLVFAVLASIPFWLEGLAWRARWQDRKRPRFDAASATGGRHRPI